ncbi:hypothetical protein AAMO2058_001394300 [Amorphochlora amoebiformis]
MAGRTGRGLWSRHWRWGSMLGAIFLVGMFDILGHHWHISSEGQAPCKVGTTGGNVADAIDGRSSSLQGRPQNHSIKEYDPLHFFDGELPDGTLKAELKDKQYFTIQYLKLCKAASGGPWGPRSFKCDQDESCLACAKPWNKEQAKRLIQAVQDPSLMHMRRSYIKQHFPDKEKPIVVIATNKIHFPYLLNWACGCKAHLNQDIRSTTLVLGADDQTYDYSIKRGFPALKPSMFNVSPRHLNETWANEWNLTRNNVAKMGFPDSMAMLVTLTSELLTLGYTVVSQDADVVWRKDVLAYLNSEHLHNVHLATQMAPRADAQGPVNTGFVLIRPSKMTRVFMRSLVELLPLFYMRVDDQVVWNSLLRHYLFRQLHVSILPRKQFLDLHDYTAEWIDDNTYLLHTVSNSKKIRYSHSRGKEKYSVMRVYARGIVSS